MKNSPLLNAGGGASNASDFYISDLPAVGSIVTLFGAVDTVIDEQEFTLRDETGSVDVRCMSGDIPLLKKGDYVAIVGKVATDFLSLHTKCISAIQVRVEKVN